MSKEPEQKVNLMVDYAFKRVFGSEDNTDILLKLLNDILYSDKRENLTSIELLNPFNLKDYDDDKLSILDIKAKSNEGSLHDIEVQMVSTLEYPKRMLYYGAGLYHSQLREGMGYGELQKTICIHIVNDTVLKGTTDYINTFELRTKGGLLLTDALSIVVIELSKFMEKLSELSSDLAKWLYFLKHSEKLDFHNLPKEFLDTPFIVRAAQEVIKMIKLKKDIKNYNDRNTVILEHRSALDARLKEGIEIGEKKGMEIGEKKGMEKGIKERNIEIAINLKRMGLSMDDIKKATGLSIDEINAL